MPKTKNSNFSILLVGITNSKKSTNYRMVRALQALGYDIDGFDVQEFLNHYFKVNPQSRFLYWIEWTLRQVKKLPIPDKFKRLYFNLPHYKQLNSALLNQVASKPYSLVLFSKVESIDWATVKDISEITTTWYFFMDPPSQSFRIQAARYAKNAHFSSATFSKVVEEFKKVNANSYWLIQGVDPDFYFPIDTKKTIDVLFVGSSSLKRKWFISKLKKNGINVHWVGEGGDFPPVYGNDLIKLINVSKIVLNINQDGQGFSNRVIQTLLTKSFMLTEYCRDLDRYFMFGQHLDVFYSFKDCVEKVNYYLTAPNKRKMIRSKGYNYASESLTWTTMLSTWIEIVKTKKSRSIHTYKLSEEQLSQ